MAAKGDDIDPETVRAARGGNALTPGLAAFTGVSFFAYLLVKAASGQTAIDAAFYGQLIVSAALAGVGVGLLVRARYFTVTVETTEGRRRIAGLSKGEQTALLARLAPGETAPDRAGD